MGFLSLGKFLSGGGRCLQYLDDVTTFGTRGARTFGKKAGKFGRGASETAQGLFPEYSSPFALRAANCTSQDEAVNMLIRNLKEYGVKGLDSENYWIRQELTSLSPEAFLKLEHAMEEASKAGYKIPYAKDAEYIEMVLPMADGKMHNVKIYPQLNKGKGRIYMRAFMDGDIPKDSCKTYKDVLAAGKTQHPGTEYPLSLNTVEINPRLLDYISTNMKGNSVYGRLTARKDIADLIRKNWTAKEANDFSKFYKSDTDDYLIAIGVKTDTKLRR